MHDDKRDECDWAWDYTAGKYNVDCGGQVTSIEDVTTPGGRKVSEDVIYASNREVVLSGPPALCAKHKAELIEGLKGGARKDRRRPRRHHHRHLIQGRTTLDAGNRR
jgi:hypothetical protein